MVLTRTFLYPFIICVALLVIPQVTYSYNPVSDNGIKAVTRPSKDVTLSFVQSGQIAKVYVKQGDMVKSGQLLVKLDDSVEQAQLAQLKVQSEDTTRIEASKASLDQKKVDLGKYQWAAERGSVTKLGLEHRKLDVKIAELSLKIVNLEHEQDKRKYAEGKMRVDKMQLKSPIDGREEELNIEEGESVESLSNVVRIVEINPLWIDVSVPLAHAKNLRNGQSVKVILPYPEQKFMEGNIIFIGTVANVGTLKTRVEVPKKSNKTAGENINVIFSKYDEKINEKK